MPFRPDVSDLHIDRPMTNMSIAYHQKESDYVASKITRAIPVMNQTNLFASYDKQTFFRDEAQKRAPATETAGSGFTVATTPYLCEEYGFHKDIPWEVRNNADAPFRVDNDARMFVDKKLLIKKDVLLAAAIFTINVWNTDVVGGTDFTQCDEWGTSLPIDDVEDARDAIHSVTGQEITTFLMGRQCWRKTKHHPTLIEKIKYTQRGVLTVDLVASLLEIPRIVIGQSLRATNVEGATAAYAYNYGKHGLFMSVDPSPGLLTPTAFVSLVWVRQGRAVTMRRLRNNWKQFDRIEGLFNIDHKITGADLGYFMQNLVS